MRRGRHPRLGGGLFACPGEGSVAACRGTHPRVSSRPRDTQPVPRRPPASRPDAAEPPRPDPPAAHPCRAGRVSPTRPTGPGAAQPSRGPPWRRPHTYCTSCERFRPYEKWVSGMSVDKGPSGRGGQRVSYAHRSRACQASCGNLERVSSVWKPDPGQGDGEAGKVVFAGVPACRIRRTPGRGCWGHRRGGCGDCHDDRTRAR